MNLTHLADIYKGIDLLIIRGCSYDSCEQFYFCINWKNRILSSSWLHSAMVLGKACRYDVKRELQYCNRRLTTHGTTTNCSKQYVGLYFSSSHMQCFWLNIYYSHSPPLEKPHNVLQVFLSLFSWVDVLVVSDMTYYCLYAPLLWLTLTKDSQYWRKRGALLLATKNTEVSLALYQLTERRSLKTLTFSKFISQK
jgi:hypothetical protein